MTGKENRPGAATPEQQMETEGFSNSTIPKDDNSIFDGNISSLLSPGQENAVPLRHLKMVTGFDGRTVRRMISEERFAGMPILADCQTGYYLPATDEEKRRCVRSMRHRAKEIERAAQAIEAAEGW